jgi:hypothetical protein
MKKNFESMYFLRNGKLFLSHAEALTNINLNSSKVGDGEALLARYKDENNNIRTIVGYKYDVNGQSSLTIIDTEGIEKAIEDVENSIPDVSGFINSVEYEENEGNHSIIFYHDNVVIDSIDASPFLIDGMIENVYIEDGNLVIDFNTASGKQDIHIPLSDIFNPELYYTKDETDAKLLEKENEIYNLTKIVGDMGGAVTYNLPNEANKSFNTLMNNNGTVKLGDDVTTGRFGPGITAKNTVKLNLNSHNLTISGLTISSAQAAIMSRGTQEITIGGKGVIDAGQGICIEANGKDSVINLTGSTTVYQTDRPGAELVYCYAGTINITNGTFKNNGSQYLLNCYDANYKNGTAKIIVTGGKFYDFNPADNSAEGEHTNFLAEGYHVETSTVVEEEVEHTVYTVKKD